MQNTIQAIDNSLVIAPIIPTITKAQAPPNTIFNTGALYHSSTKNEPNHRN